MATDQSPPRIRIILTIAFSSLVILVALNFVFRSYFLMMTEQTEHDHLAQPEELMKLRAGEERNLTTSPVPIKKAMAELHMRGREATDALKGLADITPQASDDLGPMVGWVRNQNQVYVDRVNAAASASAAAGAAPPPALLADGGAAPATAGGDAGAPAPATSASSGGTSPKPPTTPPAPAPKH
jgi:hypothetical protein